MQGLFMVAGVLVMLPLALWQVGGLGKATEHMAKMTPPLPVKIEVSLKEPASERIILPRGSWLITAGSQDSERQAFRTNVRAQFAQGAKVATLLISDGVDSSKLSALRITTPEEVQNAKATPFPLNIRVKVLSEGAYASGKNKSGVYVTGPGPSENKIGGFLPLSLAISFFFMWTFSGSGQPGNMIRLMAFRDTKTLRRSIFAVAIYYTLIYFPLVIIFCCSRVLLPGWESESDRIMPEMARVLTIGIGLPALAGLLVAAPFAAVMSTMDSFLLLVSSALVRDIYQRDINPDASEKTIKRLTYIATICVGTIAMVGAINPPVYLQDIIVYTSSGLAASFLAPMAMGLYWRRVNTRGAIAGMLCGFLAHLALYVGGYIYYGRFQPVLLFDLDPIMPGMAISLLVVIIVSLCTSPPPKDHVRKYFYVNSSKRIEKTAADASGE